MLRTKADISLLDVAKTYGTPTFVYDTNVIDRQLQRMTDAFDFPHRIHYCTKALGHPTILSYFNAKGCGLDTASYEQVLLALDVGFSPKDILFTPSGTSYERIKMVTELGVMTNFGNIEQLELFAQDFPDLPVFLRFNPDVIAGGTANVSVGHSESKFGIHINQLPHLKKVIETFDIKVIGVHVHTGSDILDVNQFVTSSQRIMNLCKHFQHLKYVNLGSGFKVKYKENDVETNIEQLGTRLKEEITKISKEVNKKLSIIVEPGKYLVSEAGQLLASVNLIKQTPNATFACLDTGFNHLVRPMYYNAYHQIENCSNPKGKIKVYHVVGYLAETDTFGWNRKIPELKEGDIVSIKNAGAYGYSMSSNYNNRPKPAEVLIHNEKCIEITKRQSFSDLNALYKKIDF